MQIPPWLDVTPGSYTAAAEAGVNAGQRARSLDMEAQAHQQALQEAQAQKAQIQAAQVQSVREHAQQQASARAAAAAQVQLQKQQIMQDMQKQNIAQAYKQMQLSQKQQEIDQKAQQAAAALDLRAKANQGLQDYRGAKNEIAQKTLELRQYQAQNGGKSDSNTQRMIADITNLRAKDVLADASIADADKVTAINKFRQDLAAAVGAATPPPAAGMPAPMPAPAGAPMGQPASVMPAPAVPPPGPSPADESMNQTWKGLQGLGMIPAGEASPANPAAAFNAANPAPTAPAQPASIEAPANSKYKVVEFNGESADEGQPEQTPAKPVDIPGIAAPKAWQQDPKILQAQQAERQQKKQVQIERQKVYLKNLGLTAGLNSPAYRSAYQELVDMVGQ